MDKLIKGYKVRYNQLLRGKYKELYVGELSNIKTILDKYTVRSK